MLLLKRICLDFEGSREELMVIPAITVANTGGVP